MYTVRLTAFYTHDTCRYINQWRLKTAPVRTATCSGYIWMKYTYSLLSCSRKCNKPIYMYVHSNYRRRSYPYRSGADSQATEPHYWHDCFLAHSNQKTYQNQERCFAHFTNRSPRKGVFTDYLYQSVLHTYMYNDWKKLFTRNAKDVQTDWSIV